MLVVGIIIFVVPSLFSLTCAVDLLDRTRIDGRTINVRYA